MKTKRTLLVIATIVVILILALSTCSAPAYAKSEHQINLSYSKTAIATDTFLVGYDASGALGCNFPNDIGRAWANKGNFAVFAGWNSGDVEQSIKCVWPDGSIATNVAKIHVMPAELHLYSARVIGPNLKLVYSKNFTAGVNPYLETPTKQCPDDANGPLSFYWTALVSEKGNYLTILIPLTSLVGDFRVGQTLTLRHPSYCTGIKSEVIKITK